MILHKFYLHRGLMWSLWYDPRDWSKQKEIPYSIQRHD